MAKALAARSDTACVPWLVVVTVPWTALPSIQMDVAPILEITTLACISVVPDPAPKSVLVPSMVIRALRVAEE